MRKLNDLLERDVNEELGSDPVLDDSRILVSTDDAWSSLTEAVQTVADVKQGSQDPGGVAGVRTVSGWSTPGSQRSSTTSSLAEPA